VSLHWVIAGAALVAALVAWSQARRTAQRLDRLSQLYWELKYRHEELRREVGRSAEDAPLAAAPGETRGADPPRPATDTDARRFIPLTAVKR
jgi:hypothetical protein